MATLFTKITAESAGSTPYEFNTVTVESGNTFEPSTDQAYAGSYSYKSGMGGSNDTAYGEKTYSECGEVWLKFRIFISSDFSFGTNNRFSYVMRLTDGGSYLILLSIRGNSATSPNQWQIEDRVNTTRTTTNFSLNSWHLVKFQWVAGASANATAKVWVDGTLVHEYINLTHNYLADRIHAGCYSSSEVPTAGSVYLDEIEAFSSDPDIGGSAVPKIMMTMNQFNGGMI